MHRNMNSQGPPDVRLQDHLRAVTDLPGCLQPAFTGCFRFFNPVQSECFQEAYDSDMNMVVSAPTGSGKTGVMEICILRLLSKAIDTHGRLTVNSGMFKTIYVGPSRALVQERCADWQKRFGALGLVCRELTGDTEVAELTDINNADIICTTPEKFDAMTRKKKDQGGMAFFGDIAICLLDEVHFLGEPGRGSALEAGVVSRIRTVGQLPEMLQLPIANVRFIAVSATLHNIQDVADWLRVPPNGLKVFGEEMRPVKLTTIVKGYESTKTDFLFERRLNDFLLPKILEYSKGRPTLVFCSSRKGAFDTAAFVANAAARSRDPGAASIFVRDAQQHQQLQAAAQQLTNKQLQCIITAGVGVHHAAMEPEERAIVERLFKEKAILVLCTTSTLATGVNLPAHLVILKGTRRWTSEGVETAGYTEYDKSTVLQMIGRAGRPQFDQEGVALIMTQRNTVVRYNNLMSGEVLESQLLETFPEHINAEIVLGTIRDIPMAVTWLQSTFLYTQMRSCPQDFGLPIHASEEDFNHIVIQKYLLQNVQLLAKHGLITTDTDDIGLRPSTMGQVMAHQCVRLPTIVLLLGVPKQAAMDDLLVALAKCSEFSHIKLRRGEKKVLNAINKGGPEGKIKYFIRDPNKRDKAKERISYAFEKIFILINDGLSDNSSEALDYSLKNELAHILRTGSRLATCMAQLYAHLGAFAATGNALTLEKALRQRMWPGSQEECRQMPNIGKLLASRLAANDMGRLRALQKADPRHIEAAAQRNYPFGNQVAEDLRRIMPPVLGLALSSLGVRGKVVQLELTLSREDNPSLATQRSHATLLAGCRTTDQLLVHEFVILEEFVSPYNIKFNVPVPPEGPRSLSIVAAVVHGRYIGVDLHCHLSGKDIVAEMPSPPQIPQGLQSWEQAGSPALDCPTRHMLNFTTTMATQPPQSHTFSGMDPVQDILIDSADLEGLGSPRLSNAPPSPPSLRAVAPKVTCTSRERTPPTDLACPGPDTLPASGLQRTPQCDTVPAQKRRRTTPAGCAALERTFAPQLARLSGDCGPDPAGRNSWSQPNAAGFGNLSSTGQGALQARFPTPQPAGRTLSASLPDQGQPSRIASSRWAGQRDRSLATLPRGTFESQLPDRSPRQPPMNTTSDQAVQVRQPRMSKYGASEALKLMDAFQNRQGAPSLSRLPSTIGNYCPGGAAPTSGNGVFEACKFTGDKDGSNVCRSADRPFNEARGDCPSSVLLERVPSQLRLSQSLRDSSSDGGPLQMARPQNLQFSAPHARLWASRNPDGSGDAAPTTQRLSIAASLAQKGTGQQGPNLLSTLLQGMGGNPQGFTWQPLNQPGVQVCKQNPQGLAQEHPLGKPAHEAGREAQEHCGGRGALSGSGWIPGPMQQPANTPFHSISDCNGSTGSPRASCAGNAQEPLLDSAMDRGVIDLTGGTAARMGLVNPSRGTESPAKPPRHGAELPIPDAAGSPHPQLRQDGQQVSDCPAASLVTDMMSVNHNHAIGAGDHFDACTSRPGRVQAGLPGSFGLDNQFDDVGDIGSIFSFL